MEAKFCPFKLPQCGCGCQKGRECDGDKCALWDVCGANPENGSPLSYLLDAGRDPRQPVQGEAGVALNMIDSDELAKRLAIGKSEVYRLSREGKLPSFKVGRYIRFDFQAVMEALERSL